MSKRIGEISREELAEQRAFLDTELPRTAQRRSPADKALDLKFRNLRALQAPAVPVVDGKSLGLGEVPALGSFNNGVGDLNLVISDVPIAFPPFAQLVHTLAKTLVTRTNGVMPEFGVYQIAITDDKEISYQVVKWELSRSVTVEELHTISCLVAEAYEADINAYGASASPAWRKIAKPCDYSGRRLHPGTYGVYFGTRNYYSSSANGVTVYRQFKNAKQAEYYRSERPIDFLSMRQQGGSQGITHIELHDNGVGEHRSGLGQDSFLSLVVQLSYLFANQKLVEPRALAATIYRELNRIGTRALGRQDLFGMYDALETVEKTILLPLQQPEEAARFTIRPESVLLVGVPGVGKTYLEHYLMAGDYNAIFVAVDSDRLRNDLQPGKEGKPSETLARADRITQLTGLPVVLIIDDIDGVLPEKGDDGIISKFLNLMQGIRQKGLYVLASTNYPEKLDRRLLEPGRLSKIFHARLPNFEERKGVLLTYLCKQPFATTKQCEEVAVWCAQETDGWTQRFLWELTVDGARNCILRGPRGYPVLEDFKRAHRDILRTRNFDEIREWDEQIAKFVSSHRRKVGF